MAKARGDSEDAAIWENRLKHKYPEYNETKEDGKQDKSEEKSKAAKDKTPKA